MPKKLGNASFRFESLNDGQMAIRHFEQVGDKPMLVEEIVIDTNDLATSEVYKTWFPQAVFTTLSARVSQVDSKNKLAAMRDVWELWTVNEEWKSATRAGAGMVSRTLILAIAECLGLSEDVALNSYKAASKETQEKIKAREDIVAAKARHDAEAKKAQVVDLADFS